jgi:ribosomal protein S6--L-glutamate ligase
MKGFVYYTLEESLRNKAFIDDLVKEAARIDIILQLLVDEELPDSDADFILFRDRNPHKANAFEDAGFRVFNRAEVNRIANDKLKAFELATLLGIPAVPTKQIRIVDEILTFPCVLKTVDGHGGSEVFLCASANEADTFLKKLGDRKLIVQPYIESGSQDVRVFMIGEEVVGAVKRTGSNSFKSNYTLGGTVEKYILSAWQEKEAKTIVKALRSDYIGIDFLLLPDGRWMLNEVEDPVGARSFYNTYEVSIARLLIMYIKESIQ